MNQSAEWSFQSVVQPEAECVGFSEATQGSLGHNGVRLFLLAHRAKVAGRRPVVFGCF